MVRKKKILVVCAVVLVIVGLISEGVHMKNKRQRSQDKTAAKSTTATTGTIRQTVEGSGSLEASDVVNVQIPADLEIEEVYVSSGDKVKKGTSLAKVSKASVAKALVEVEETLENIEDQLDDDDDLSTLETTSLKAQKEELTETEEMLKKLEETRIIKATASGIIGTVNVEATTSGTQISNVDSQTSSSESGASATKSASNDTAKTVTATRLASTVSMVTGPQARTMSLLQSSGTKEEKAPEEATTEQKAMTEEATTEQKTTTEEATTEQKTTTEKKTTTQKSSNSTTTQKTVTSPVQQPTSQTGKNTAIAAGTGSTSSAQTGNSSSETDYSDSQITAFTIMKEKNAKVVLSVDELDILSVEVGQTAEISLDAVEDQTFEGTITRVSNTSSSDSGNAKYDVEITLPMEDTMRLGMSASATILVKEASDVLVIPMTALQENGDRTFVYTKQESDGTLSGEVEVETGLSDGSQVQITSGLCEGDVVYYLRSGDSGETSTNEGMKGGMPGAGGVPSENMPSGNGGPGGTAPSGDRRGKPGMN